MNEQQKLKKSLSDCSACREKYWEELTDAERIGKLADTIEYQQRTIDELEILVDILRTHIHSNNGDIFKPAFHQGNTLKSYRSANPLGRAQGRK